MNFEEFLKETGEVSETMARKSHTLATVAKTASSEMRHDNAARKHIQAAEKKRSLPQNHPGTGI